MDLKRFPLLPVLLFAFLLGLFWFGFSTLSERHQNESQALSLQSIERAIVTCYAIEGMYPPSFAYLEQNYSVRINTEKYYVDYLVLGSNIRPVVQLIERSSFQTNTTLEEVLS